MRTGPLGSLFAALTRSGTPVNAAVSRPVNAATPGCPCLVLGCQAWLPIPHGRSNVVHLAAPIAPRG